MESLISENYVSIDPAGSGDIQTGETITETESLIDIGELIGKYAFGDTFKYRERKVRLVQNKDYTQITGGIGFFGY